MEQNFIHQISTELSIRDRQVANTIELLDNENTIPFIVRYRKELTGGLDEEKVRKISERIKYLRSLQQRKEEVIKLIKEQGKLTQELEKKINSAHKLQEVEDLYLPYKPKKRTRAIIAKEKGLEPLAFTILSQQITSGSIDEICKEYINIEKGVDSIDSALAGARDIIAEIISDDADILKFAREHSLSSALLTASVVDEELDQEGKYKMYYEYKENVRGIAHHRVLAVNRGEREGVLKVKLEMPDKEIISKIEKKYLSNPQSIFTEHLKMAIDDSYKRLISPTIEREVRNEITDKAEEHAIGVFSTNLRNLLLQPPVRGKVIMGIDPGFRTGCKIAIVDAEGKYIEGAAIYPHEPRCNWDSSKQIIKNLIEKHNVGVIAIGDGTASRETETLIAEIISTLKKPISYTIVSEAGASVYSVSEIAKEEFPNLDASMRGNISIARRLLDPLSELVKIDPKSIGVGLYQHDVNQKKLDEALDAVVESCVNYVGVDLNTASVELLKYVAGISSRVAKNIKKYRDENGRFKTREELKNVPGIGEKIFEQSAGFLKIPNGENPLDNTFIHPESYPACSKLLQKFGIKDPATIPEKIPVIKLKMKAEGFSLEKLSEEIGIGIPTLRDILDNLERPGRDPREEFPGPIFRKDVLKIEDLKPNMVLKGTVRNVVDFGAFIDIGVKEDGLLHISEIKRKSGKENRKKNPLKMLAVGDVINVKVLKVDPKRGRIALSMKV